MIVYFDTSAVVPILIAEPSTEICRRAWVDADRRISSRLTYVETAAALSMAQRLGRISADEHAAAWRSFAGMWPDFDVVELTEELSATAAGLTQSLVLRGYDAVHCASAATINDPELVAVAGDLRLLNAWLALGIAVIDTNQNRRS